MDYRTRSETQAVRVCAGILLLIITMILTRLQIDDSSAIDSTSGRKAKNLGSMWSHAETCNTNMTSTIHYINTWPTPVVMTYQSYLPGDLRQFDVMSLTEDSALSAAAPGNDFAFMAMSSLNDTLLGVRESSMAANSRTEKILPLLASKWCDIEAKVPSSCLLTITANLNDPTCLKARYLEIRSNATSFPGIKSPCHQAKLTQIETGQPYPSPIQDLLPIATDTILPSLVTEGDEIFYVSGSGLNLRLHAISSDGKDVNAQLPLVEESEILKLSYISTLNNRLGNGQQNGPNGIKVTDIPVYREVDTLDAFSMQERAAALPPLIIYPAETTVAVLRAGSNLGVIIHIFKRPDLRLLKSIQFDNMDSAWVIRAPDSTAKDYLILMGSAPPYAWQTEAIDLAAGTVETRHSFM